MVAIHFTVEPQATGHIAEHRIAKFSNLDKLPNFFNVKNATEMSKKTR